MIKWDSENMCPRCCESESENLFFDEYEIKNGQIEQLCKCHNCGKVFTQRFEIKYIQSTYEEDQN